MEQLTLKKMREIIGWPDREGDGIFSPGKSQIFEAICLGTAALNRWISQLKDLILVLVVEDELLLLLLLGKGYRLHWC